MAIAEEQRPLRLTEKLEIVQWPETHYVFVEKIGPFQTNAPQAWQDLQRFVPRIAGENTITGYFSLYDTGTQIYRAGVSIAAEPKGLSDGLQYMLFKGGKYGRFVLTGPYSQLPEASCRVFQIVSEKKIPLRADFNIENYVNNPKVTPEEELITEILFPMV